MVNNVYQLMAIPLLAFFMFTACSSGKQSTSSNNKEKQPVSVREKKKGITFVFETKANPPFCLGKGTAIDWQKPGITLEVLKLIEKQLNIKIHFKRNPWKRALALLENNEVQGVFHASFKKERMRLGVYPMKNGAVDPDRSLMTNTYYVYKLKSSSLQWDGKQFTNLKNDYIGITFGYSISSDLKKWQVPVQEAKNTITNFRKLANGRLAAVADLGTMADIHLKNHPEKFTDIVKVKTPLKSKPYYLILSHDFVNKQPDLAQKIWHEISRIKISGDYDKIAAKY